MKLSRYGSQQSRSALGRVAVSFDKPGRYEIVAVLGADGDAPHDPGTYADTVNVDVVDMPKR